MEIRGRDYASAGMIDPTTALGLRVSMLEAVEAWNALPAGSRNDERAIAVVGATIRSNDLLRAAGTQEIAARFYEHMLGGGDADAFLNAIGEVDSAGFRQDIAAYNGSARLLALLANTEMRDTLEAFVNASRDHLGVEGALINGFVAQLQSNSALTQGITVTPTALSAQQAQLVASYDGIFRQLDGYAPVSSLHLVAAPPQHILNALNMENSASMDFNLPVPPAIAAVTDTGFAGVMRNAALDTAIQLAGIGFDPAPTGTEARDLPAPSAPRFLS